MAFREQFIMLCGDIMTGMVEHKFAYLLGPSAIGACKQHWAVTGEEGLHVYCAGASR